MFRPFISMTCERSLANTTELTREWVGETFGSIIRLTMGDAAKVVLEMLYLNLYNSRNMISCVASVKTATGWGLKDTKDFMCENGMVENILTSRCEELQQEIERLHNVIAEEKNNYQTVVYREQVAQEHLAEADQLYLKTKVKLESLEKYLGIK